MDRLSQSPHTATNTYDLVTRKVLNAWFLSTKCFAKTCAETISWQPEYGHLIGRYGQSTTCLAISTPVQATPQPCLHFHFKAAIICSTMRPLVGEDPKGIRHCGHNLGCGNVKKQAPEQMPCPVGHIKTLPNMTSKQTSQHHRILLKFIRARAQMYRMSRRIPSIP